MPLHKPKNENGAITNSKNRGKSYKPTKLKEYKIDNTLMSEWFGYNNVEGFTNSNRKHSLYSAVDEIIKYIEAFK
jgi:hypothetical protein